MNRHPEYNSETNGDKNWLQKASREMEENDTKGSFTRQAERADMSVQQFARYVLQHKGQFTTRTVRRAVFARNVAGFDD